MFGRRLALPITLAALAACSDSTPLTPNRSDALRPQAVVAACPSPTQIQTQINTLFVGGQKTAALSKFSSVQSMVTAGKMSQAVAKMFTLVDWTLAQYRASKLAGGQAAATQAKLVALTGALYCFVGLGTPSLSAAALGPDGAVAVVYPTSADTVIKTATGWSEVVIPAGAVPGNQPVLISISRLPESSYETPTAPFAGPLATTLNQYPLFYEYSVSPAVTFAVPVTVGICLRDPINLSTPPGSRLRVAHNVSPTSIAVLPWATPPVLDCSSVVTASAASVGPVLAQDPGLAGALQVGVQRTLDWLLPPRLEAAVAGTTVRGTCCLGGTTRTFSPFGGVDTLGFLSPRSSTSQSALPNTAVAEPPKVKITTDPALGAQPIPGVTVTFQVISGGGTLNGTLSTVVATTDGNGEAGVASWELGSGASQVIATPSYVPGTGFSPGSVLFEASTVVLSAGQAHACAIRDQDTWCWGNNSHGATGTGSIGVPTPLPAIVTGGHTFVTLSAGLEDTCALDGGGQAWCWGLNLFGELGDGTTTNSGTPVAVNTVLRFTSIATAIYQTCGLTSSHQLWCWGTSLDGLYTLLAPFAITPPLGVTIAAAPVGTWGICMLSTAGAAYCWGLQNDSGMLGIGSNLAPTTPTPVTGGLTFLDLVTYNKGSVLGHTCGVATGGVAYCWGANTDGQLGIAAAPDTCSSFNPTSFPCALAPQQVATGYSFRSVTPGRLHTCGLTGDGHAACWGRNTEGQLGDGTTTSRSTPAYAAIPGTASVVSPGDLFTCAAVPDNNIYCWGSNARGELGIGTTPGSSATPVKVLWGIQSVLVTPTGATVHVGGALQMAATVTLDPTASGTPAIAWSSTDNSKATVSGAGLVTGIAVGTVGIRATATLGTSTASGTAALTIVP